MTSALRAVALGTAALAFVLPGCTGPLDAPSAYSEVRVLCRRERAAEWEAEIARCREDFVRSRACLGVIGFDGHLEEEPLAVQTRLTALTLSGVPEATERRLGAFTAHGTGPYFFFQLDAKSIGDAVRPSLSWERQLTDVSRGEGHYSDDTVELAFRMSVGGESANLRARRGTMSMRALDDVGLRGAFHGEFGGAGHLDGCFVLFDPSFADGGR